MKFRKTWYYLNGIGKSAMLISTTQTVSLANAHFTHFLEHIIQRSLHSWYFILMFIFLFLLSDSSILKTTFNSIGVGEKLKKKKSRNKNPCLCAILCFDH